MVGTVRITSIGEKICQCGGPIVVSQRRIDFTGHAINSENPSSRQTVPTIRPCARRTSAWRRNGRLERSAENLGSRSCAKRRTAQWRDLLHAEGGKGADRTMALVLQYHQTSQRPPLQTTGAGSDLARHQCTGLRCTPATTWGLATTPDSLTKGGPLRSSWSAH